MSTCHVDVAINEEIVRVDVDTRTTVLELLRDQLNLKGTKLGCGLGECGACTVHLEGQPVLSCLVLACSVNGKRVTTVEGVGNSVEGKKVQEAFVTHDGFQCGYCTSGQVMSALYLINKGVRLSDNELREYMSGNLCRCGAYPNIIDAIRAAMGD